MIASSSHGFQFVLAVWLVYSVPQVSSSSAQSDDCSDGGGCLYQRLLWILIPVILVILIATCVAVALNCKHRRKAQSGTYNHTMFPQYCEEAAERIAGDISVSTEANSRPAPVSGSYSAIYKQQGLLLLCRQPAASIQMAFQEQTWSPALQTATDKEVPSTPQKNSVDDCASWPKEHEVTNCVRFWVVRGSGSDQFGSFIITTGNVSPAGSAYWIQHYSTRGRKLLVQGDFDQRSSRVENVTWIANNGRMAGTCDDFRIVSQQPTGDGDCTGLTEKGYDAVECGGVHTMTGKTSDPAR